MVGKKAESLTWGQFVVDFLGRCVHVFTLSTGKVTRRKPEPDAFMFPVSPPCSSPHPYLVLCNPSNKELAL
jgi:hypothetical protein